VPRLFEPFRRLASDRVGSDRGAGLGLSIVAAVVRAHAGLINTVPRAGGGLEVTVRLDAALPDAPPASPAAVPAAAGELDYEPSRHG
jgi:signal transduction histidine kinase